MACARVKGDEQMHDSTSELEHDDADPKPCHSVMILMRDLRWWTYRRMASLKGSTGQPR